MCALVITGCKYSVYTGITGWFAANCRGRGRKRRTRRCSVGKVERRFIYNVRKERKTVMAACARARMPTYISQPASSRQLSSDITEPKARAAVMQFESARLTLRIVARIRDAACVARAERAFQPRAFTSMRERKKERKGTAGILFFLYSRIFFEISPIVCLYSMFQRAWRDIRFGIGSVEILSLSKVWLISIRVLNIEENVKGEREKKKYVLLVYLYSSLRMEF